MGDENIVINYSANKLASGSKKYVLDKINISESVSVLRFKAADKLGLRPNQLGTFSYLLFMEVTIRPVFPRE